MMKRHVAGAALCGAVLASTPAVRAQPSDACSRDVLHVTGIPVEVVLCVVPHAGRHKDGTAVDMAVSETLSTRGSGFSRTVPLEFMDSGEATRTMDDVALQRLGIPKSLHLTIRYGPAGVRLEHAMLLPDAVTLK